tara:strand:+ start:1248 stop:1856 length:609 start_codon:yes stop_codon:yes gene_type:complete
MSSLFNILLNSKKYDNKYYEKPKKLGQPAKLKKGYISSQTPLGGFGDPVYSTPARKSTRYNPKIGSRSTTIPGNYIYEDPKIELERQQRAYQQQLQATASKSQSDIAKQLRIVQNERSAVSKLSQDYADMIKKEAAAKEKAMQDAKIAAATTAANQSRASQTSNLQIQPASQTERAGGTKIFKRRGTTASRFMSGISGMVNI